MPDQRSVMKEYRFLDAKRLSQGLSPEEQARFAKLKDLVGPETGAGGLKPGFDVNAAAAQLRESLLPAGLRSRPPPPPPPAPAPEPEPVAEEPTPAGALEEIFDQAPFSPVEGGAAEGQPDALFDPSSLGTEQPGVDPNAQAYDAGAQPYDPNAAYAADPNAAYPADPNAAYPADPNAAYPADAAYDPNAQPAWDPNQAWDPDATQPEGFDPSAQPYDPNAAYAADPNAAYPADPNAAYPADTAYDPNAQPAWDPNQPDPNAPQPEGYDACAQPYDPSAAYAADPNAAYPADASSDPNAQPALDPNQPWDASAAAEPAPGEAGLPEGGSFVAGDSLSPAGWDAEPAPAEPAVAPEFGEYDAAGGGLAVAEDAGLAAEPPLSPEALLGEPSPSVTAEPFGEYDDSAGFGAAPFDAGEVQLSGSPAPESSVPAPELGGWQTDPALGGDFHAESGGSFGAGADAAAPEWAAGPSAPPWEAASLDLGAPAEPGAEESAAGFEVASAPEQDAFAAREGELFGEPGGDLAGEELVDLTGAEPEEGSDLDFSNPDLAMGEVPSGEAELAEPVFTEAAGPVFGEAADAPGAEPEPTPAEPLELALSEAAAAPHEAELAAEPYDAAAPAAEEVVALEAEPAMEAAPLEQAQPMTAEEEIPVLDGADILEEIVEEAPAPPPQSLDFEPLVPPPPAVAPAPAVASPAVIAPPQALAPPPPAAAIAPPPPAAEHHVAGSHRVVVHTVEGIVKRGVLEEADLDGPFLALAPQPGIASESLATDKVKAIFFMLAPGEKPPPAEGKKVRVTFRDGRQVAGFSPDYREEGVGFFMIPGDSRTNTGRIWVYRAAVRQVAVS
jgi:hypothetical protein